MTDVSKKNILVLEAFTFEKKISLITFINLTLFSMGA